MVEEHHHQPRIPLYVFGVLRVVMGTPQTGAEMRLALRERGFDAEDCELWAQLFDTFAADGFHTPATDKLLRDRRADYEALAARAFDQ